MKTAFVSVANKTLALNSRLLRQGPPSTLESWGGGGAQTLVWITEE